jgi:hypothetical protein
MQSERQIGVSFETQQAADAAAPKETASEERGADHVVRSQTLALRSALD